MRAILTFPILCIALAGCETAPTDAAKLKGPARYLMVSPCPQPLIPADEADPAKRAQYYASSRQCAAENKNKVHGLQRYVRAVRGQS